MSSTYTKPPEPEAEQACGCFAFLIQCCLITWILTSHFDVVKAILVALVMTLMTWVLALMGIVPIIGQWLYSQFAEGIITWIYGLLQVDPNILLPVPDWINFVLKWILGGEEVTGTLGTYTYAIGYTLSILVSFAIVVGIIIWIVALVQMRRSESA